MQMPDSTRKYTPEEKQQLIKNLDIEVEHRVRQLEEWLAVALQNFRLHQEGLISRIPKLVRGVTMGDFADKYNGGCRMNGWEWVGRRRFEIDRDTRKRKWAAAQEEVEASGSGQGQGQQGEQGRTAKNGASPFARSQGIHVVDKNNASHTARTMPATPKKKFGGPSNTQPTPRAFSMARTPGTVRTTTRLPIPHPSPSPHKLTKPSFVPARSTSPSKYHGTPANNQRTRPPSSATFNPTMLPPKAPTYPLLRAPRRDESMLSVNGSPLANPYALGLGWFTGGDEDGDDRGEHGPKTLRRVNSIVIRHDPSVTIGSTSSTQPQQNGTTSRTHSRANSADAERSSLSHQRTPSRRHLPSVHSASSSALVSIPTKDGHILEFDPLSTSPRALEKLKEAREEITRLVTEASRKWVIE
ncbi:hypothetical protein BU15DRAFT_90373 [Melanogaster broomeanus]|nr:hypothetical protein BU15DRAFT_90373 [Melanogaster broomeanus]